jgi:hypothetical protein
MTIMIAGAGLVGAHTVRPLQTHGARVVLYELEPTPD